MPKKFAGENSKAAVAKARKEAIRSAESEKKQKEKDDAYWADDDKNIARKQQRKDEKEKKKLEVVERKAQIKAIHDEEMSSLKAAKPPPPTKITRTQIAAIQAASNAKATVKPTLVEEETEIDLVNVNHLNVDGIEARTVEEAIAALSTGDTGVAVDKHPEKRMKAAYQEFETKNLPVVKAENPNLRLSQLKQMLRKEWNKSPDNPMNQRLTALRT